MRIQRQRTRDAAAQGVMHHEVHRTQVRQRVALDAAVDHAAVVLAHALRRQRALQQRVVRQVARNDAQRGAVALVAGSGQRDVTDLHGASSRMWHSVGTASRGISADAAATTSRTPCDTPPPAAGPFR